MANYSDDFDGYSAGSGLPSGWTDRWDAGTWSIVDDSGDKVLREASAGNNRYFASMDAINSDADRDDVEILAKFRVSLVAASGTTYGGLVLRGSGNGSSENGYSAILVHAGGVLYFRIGKYLSGTSSAVSSDSAATNGGNGFGANEWWWFRFRANGTTISLKFWADGQEEPASPQISVTDSNVTGTGWAGAFRFAGGFNFEWGEMAIATNGDTASITAAGAALEGAPAGVATSAGGLTTQIPLAGAAAGVATATGTEGDALVAGAAAGVATAAGDLSTDIPLAGAAAGQANAAGALNAIAIRADYERSSVKLADSSVTGTGDSAVISIKPRFQASEVTSGESRWLEPSARVDGVNGLRPTFRFLSYLTSGTGMYHGQPWPSTRRPMFTYSLDYPITWTYFDTAVTVDTTNHWVEFRHSTAFTGNTVYIARSRQIPVAGIGQWCEAMAADYPGVFVPSPTAVAFTPTLTSWPGQSFIADEYSAQTNELGETIPATPLYGAMIDDTSLTPEGGVAKRIAQISSGLHAGEDHGTYVMMAFVAAFLGESDWAVRMRTNYILLISPCENAPGRAGGGWRGSYTTGAGGIDDPNRHASDASPNLEVVTKPRTARVTDRGGLVPDWFIDFHGTYGNTWAIFSDSGKPLHATFTSRLASYSGKTISDEGDTSSGFLSRYFQDTVGSPFSITFEFGDPSMVSDADIDTVADAAVRTLDSMFYMLVAAATAQATATGALTGGSAALAGDAAAEAAAAGGIDIGIELAGAPAGVATAGGGIDTEIALAGAAAGVATAAGAATIGVLASNARYKVIAPRRTYEASKS